MNEDKLSLIKITLYTLLTIFNGIALIGMCWETPHRDIAIWTVCGGLAILFLAIGWDFLIYRIFEPVACAVYRTAERIFLMAARAYRYFRSKR